MKKKVKKGDLRRVTGSGFRNTVIKPEDAAKIKERIKKPEASPAEKKLLDELAVFKNKKKKVRDGKKPGANKRRDDEGFKKVTVKVSKRPLSDREENKERAHNIDKSQSDAFNEIEKKVGFIRDGYLRPLGTTKDFELIKNDLPKVIKAVDGVIELLESVFLIKMRDKMIFINNSLKHINNKINAGDKPISVSEVAETIHRQYLRIIDVRIQPSLTKDIDAKRDVIESLKLRDKDGNIILPPDKEVKDEDGKVTKVRDKDGNIVKAPKGEVQRKVVQLNGGPAKMVSDATLLIHFSSKLNEKFIEGELKDAVGLERMFSGYYKIANAKVLICHPEKLATLFGLEIVKDKKGKIKNLDEQDIQSQVYKLVERLNSHTSQPPLIPVFNAAQTMGDFFVVWLVKKVAYELLEKIVGRIKKIDILIIPQE